MFKTLLAWFKFWHRIFIEDNSVDEFIRNIINLHKTGRVSFKRDYAVIEVYFDNKIMYSIWDNNRYYGWLSQAGIGKDYDNLYENKMPSRRTMYDFLQIVKDVPEYEELNNENFIDNRLFYENNKIKSLFP